MPRSQVDEQVVKMSFDNSNFDGNINDSINALNKLDNKLLALNRENFSSLNNSLNNLTNTFSVKGQIMFGVLSNLGKDIYGLGKDIKNYLFKGIKDGIGEYNTIIDSTEAIYQNVKQSGNSLKDVNNALDELNDYADKTIYNFGQMTRMIGMFSSAGVGLKSSVSTIKGLANSAALVGANMQRAQIAWNAVSRAMSSGRFTNVTWRSLELSGIAGKQFNKVITEVARTMKVKGKQTGKDIDGMIKKWGSLRESLREGWLTKDVFTQAMDIMSGALSDADLKRRGYTEKQIKELRAIADAAEEAATRVKTFKQLMDTIGEAIGSGWAQSFRILIGDLEEAKKLYTRISNVISDFIDNNANIRNELFKQIVNGKDRSIDGKWKSGRDNFRQIIENMLAIVKTFLKSVKTGFYNIFPVERMAAAGRKFLEFFQNFTKAFVINAGKVNKAGETLWDTSSVDGVTKAIENLIRFFRGLASAADLAWMAISQPIKAIIERIPFFDDFFNNTNKRLVGIIEKLGKFGDRLTVVRDVVKDYNLFGYIIGYVIDNIDELGKKYPVLGAILWIFNGIKKALKGLKDTLKELNIKPLSAAFGLFKMVVTALWRALNGIFEMLKTAKNSVDWSWLEGPKKVIINFLRTLSDYGRGLISFEQATGRIGGFIGNLFSKLSNIFKKTNIAGKVKTASYEMEKSYSKLNVVVDKTGKKVTTVWDKVKSFFTPIVDLFKNIDLKGELTFDNIAKKIGLIGGGVAAATISISHLIKTFGKIKIIDNINNLLTAGIDVIKAYQREAQSKAILNIAVAIGILAVSMAALAFIDYEKLENGLVVFTSFMAVLSMTLPPIINAIAKFNNSISTMNESEKPLNALIKTLGKFGKQISSGLNARMIGKAFKDIAIGVFILVGAISALVLLFKYDRDNTITAVITLAKVIGILTVAVGGLVIVMNLFSKSVKKNNTSVDYFAQFFKLSGVARVILALSASVLVLVGALAIMTKLDSNKLYESWSLLMAIIGYMGIIAIAIASISTRANDFGKLKKITISLSGAVLGLVAIIGAMSLLISVIKNDTTGAWGKAIGVFSSVISQFTAMTAVLLVVAKKVGGQTTIWTKLEKMMSVMTLSLVAIAGVLYLLGYSKPIPASIVTTIGIMTAAMLGIISLLALVAIVTSKAKSTFTTNFVKVIEGISLSIAALISSLGVMTAGIGALIFALSSIDISSSNANRASTNIVNKLAYIAEVIAKALPELKKLFYNIGQSIGTVFTSFTTGFVNQVISVGETYNEVAEKFVNLIIDLLGKVVGILKNRKDDIAKIIGDIVDFLGTEITAALNAFFKKDGEGIFKEEDVMSWVGGLGALVIVLKAVIPSVLKCLSNYNTLVTSFKNSKDTINGLKSSFDKLNRSFKTSVNLAKEGKGAFASFSSATKGSLFTSSAGNIIASIGAIAVAILGIVAAITAVRGAWKRWQGEVEDSYKMEDLFSMKGLEQVLVDGFEKLGRIVIQFGLTIARGLLGIVTLLAAKCTEILTQPIAGWADLLYQTFGWEWAKGISDNLGNVVKGLNDTAEKSFGSIVTGWKNVWNDDSEIGLDFFDKNLQKNLDEANKTAYNGAKENLENYKKGAKDGMNGMEEDLVGIQRAANAGLIEGAKVDLDEHSPSKKSYGIYWNYILGAKNALSDGGKVLVKAMEDNNQKVLKATIVGSKNLKEAYAKVGVDTNARAGLNKYTGLKYTAENEDGSKEQRKVDLNKKLTEAILEQEEALRGLSKEEAFSYINQQNMINGLGASAQEVADLTNFLYDQHANRTTLWHDAVEKLRQETTMDWSIALSSEQEAAMKAVENQENTNQLLVNAADKLKNQLVGKKAEQAKEILKQELIQQGMSEEQAEEEAAKYIALVGSRQSNKKKIELKGLNDAKTIMQAEIDTFRESQTEQTEILEKALAERTKAQAEASKATQEIQKNGFYGQKEPGKGMTVTEYYQKLKAQVEANNKVKIASAKLDEIIQEAEKRLEKNGLLNSNQFKSDYDKYLKEINKNKTKNSNIKDVLSSAWDKIKNSLPSTPDLTTWKMPTTNQGGNLKDDKNKAVDAARDLKKDLEKERADLTPTFDLDKLASDANKANGIVMSSLMAAQNASIGDYINKDSELNPFMKDRWQNVYNFTQNNYSPKALSRIDIYRQTQRQLSMSRGF